MADVRYHPEAERELREVEASERVAIVHAVEKLEAMGSRLAYPHQSKVQGARDLRELRPRAGRSPYRAFYRQLARERFVIGAIGPEAEHDRRGFRRAVDEAQRRLDSLQID